jgi:hypothetical protein
MKGTLMTPPISSSSNPPERVVIIDKPGLKIDIDGDGIGDVAHTTIAKELFLLKSGKKARNVEFIVKEINSPEELFSQLQQLEKEVDANHDAYDRVIMTSGAEVYYNEVGGQPAAYSIGEEFKPSFSALTAIAEHVPTYLATTNDNTKKVEISNFSDGPMDVSTSELSVDNFADSDREVSGGFSYRVKRGRLQFFDNEGNKRLTDISASSLTANEPEYKKHLDSTPATDEDYSAAQAIIQKMVQQEISVDDANSQIKSLFTGKSVDTSRLDTFGFQEVHTGRERDLGQYAAITGDVYKLQGRGVIVDNAAVMSGFSVTSGKAEYTPGGYEARKKTVPVEPFTSWATPMAAGIDSKNGN